MPSALDAGLAFCMYGGIYLIGYILNRVDTYGEQARDDGLRAREEDEARTDDVESDRADP